MASDRAGEHGSSERREVVRAVADEMALWLGAPGGRVVLIRDDEGRHRGPHVLAVDARVLRAVASAASDDVGDDVLHVFVQSAAPSPQEGWGGRVAAEALQAALADFRGDDPPDDPCERTSPERALQNVLDAADRLVDIVFADPAPPPAGVQVDREAVRARVVAWFADDLTYDRYKGWSDEQLADSLLAALAPLLGSPGESEGQACALCGEDGGPKDPLQWCDALNGERMLAHGWCWTTPDLEARLVALKDGPRDALGSPGETP